MLVLELLETGHEACPLTAARRQFRYLQAGTRFALSHID